MKALRIHSLALLTIFLLAVCASAQGVSGRTVTNADLEKYRAVRVKADEEYRQNYAQRGLPSPEELERLETERQQRLSILSSQLESKRLLKEYAEQMSRAANAESQQPIIYLAPQDNYGNSFGYLPFAFDGFGGTRFRNLSNVQMIRDQANMFTNPALLFDQTHGNSRRNSFRGGARPVFSPRR